MKDNNSNVEELTEALKKIGELMSNKENLEKLSNEELLKCNEQINRIKAIITSKIIQEGGRIDVNYHLGQNK